MPHSDDKALKYFNGQHKLNLRHAKWASFFQCFYFDVEHKKGNTNVVADASSTPHSLLAVMEARVLGFHSTKFSTTKVRILAAILMIKRVGCEALILSKKAS